MLQLDIDFRLHFNNAVSLFVNDFAVKWAAGIIAAARLSRKSDVVELLREYDSVQHSAEAAELGSSDHMYAILAMLQLLPSCNTRQKAKLSSAELQSHLITFKPTQTSIELFLTEKNSLHKQPLLLCLGSKDDPGTFYLILDVKAVSLGECGVVRAVDVLFKSHFIFWVDYAKSLAYFMEFLQKLVYKIEPSKVSARVRELNSSVRALLKTSDA